MEFNTETTLGNVEELPSSQWEASTSQGVSNRSRHLRSAEGPPGSVTQVHFFSQHRLPHVVNMHALAFQCSCMAGSHLCCSCSH